MAEVDENNLWHGTIKEALEKMLIAHDDCMCDKAKDLIKHILKSVENDYN